MSKLPTDDFISCHDGHPDSKCRICTENNCNKNIYPSSRQYCYRCNSTTDVNCEEDPNVVQPCPIYDENDACVTQWIDGVTRRDCASEISCEGLGRQHCRICSGDACNHVSLASQYIGEPGMFTDLPLNCNQCSSIEECKLSNDALGVCTGNPKQTCTTVFNKDGDVVARGCSDSVDDFCSEEDNLCIDCKSNGCNSAKNESDFVDCIYCDAQNGDDCTFNVDAIKRTRKCHKGCMTALYPRTKEEHPVYELIRTCLDDKDLDDRNKCESSQDPKCKSCSGEKCNKDDLGKRKSCYQCKGDECQLAEPKTCRAVMDNDQCFQQWDEKGSLVELGCKSKYDPAEVDILLKGKYLWLCDDDNCNDIENIPKSQTCVICNSKTDANCAIKPSSVKAYTTCARTPYTQCYSRVLDSKYSQNILLIRELMFLYYDFLQMVTPNVIVCPI